MKHLALLLLFLASASLAHGQDADALYRRGLEEERAGRPETALETYRRARRADPEHAGANYRMGALILETQGDVDSFLEHLALAVRAQPRNAEYRVARAKVYAEHANYENALTDLDAALGAEPGNVAARRARLDVAFSMGMWDTVVADCESLASAPDARPDLLSIKGRALFRVGRFTEALETFDKEKASGRAGPKTAAYRARCYAGLGLHDLALKEFDALLQKTPTDAALLRDRAGCFLALGKYAASASDLERAVTLEPEAYGARMQLARVLLLGGEYDRAVRSWDEVLRRWPDAPVRRERGHALLLAGRAGDAAGDLQEAARLPDAGPGEWIDLATARLAAGDTPGAVRAMSEATARRPQDPRLRLLQYAFESRSGRGLAAQTDLAAFRSEYAGRRDDWAAVAVALLSGDDITTTKQRRQRERALGRPMTRREEQDLAANVFLNDERATRTLSPREWACLREYYVAEWLMALAAGPRVSEMERARLRHGARLRLERMLAPETLVKRLPEAVLGRAALNALHTAGNASRAGRR